MSLQQLIGNGFAAFNAGDMATAEALFQQALPLAPDHPGTQFGLGMVRFQTGDYAAAVTPLARAASGGVGMPDSWRYLCHALAMTGRDTELVAMLGQNLAPPLKAGLAFQIFNNRVVAGDHAGIQNLAALLPPDDALQMAGAYWAATDLATTDAAGSTALFKRAARHAEQFRAAGHDSELIDSHIANSASMEDDAFVLDDSPIPDGHGKIEMLCDEAAADPSRGVVFAAADARYFEIFADDCARSLAALGPGRTFHIHVVNPAASSEAAMARLRADHPGLAFRFSIERTLGAGDAVYYACARFLRLGAVMARYRAAILMTDIDGLFGPASARLPANGADMAFFQVDTVFPSLRCHAALIQIADSAGGRHAAALVDRFLRRKLRERRNWTLDQVALFCVTRAIAAHHPEIVIADMAALLGASMAETIGSQGSFEQKRQLRIAASQA